MTNETRIRHRSRPDGPGRADKVTRDASPVSTPDTDKLGAAQTAEQTRSADAAPAPEMDRGYPVGFRKPPVHTQFKPGRSGNPRGRPKRSKQLNTLIDKELSATVVVREGGMARSIPKREALAKQIVKKGLEGNYGVIQMLLRITEDLTTELKAEVAAAEAAKRVEASVDESAKDILKEYEAQLKETLRSNKDWLTNEDLPAFEQDEKEVDP